MFSSEEVQDHFAEVAPSVYAFEPFLTVRITQDGWRKKNPDKLRAQLSRYRAKHRERILAYKKAWRAKKKAEALAASSSSPGRQRPGSL